MYAVWPLAIPIWIFIGPNWEDAKYNNNKNRSQIRWVCQNRLLRFLFHCKKIWGQINWSRTSVTSIYILNEKELHVIRNNFIYRKKIIYTWHKHTKSAGKMVYVCATVYEWDRKGAVQWRKSRKGERERESELCPFPHNELLCMEYGATIKHAFLNCNKLNRMDNEQYDVIGRVRRHTWGFA